MVASEVKRLSRVRGQRQSSRRKVGREKIMGSNEFFLREERADTETEAEGVVYDGQKQRKKGVKNDKDRENSVISWKKRV